MPLSTHLEVIPLGGLGEFGMNMMVLRLGTDCVVLDVGMMFPGAEHLGVDVVIPDMAFLQECGTIHGVLLTHGHEDHIGALSYLLADHDLPIMFGTGNCAGTRFLPMHAAYAVRYGLSPQDALQALTMWPAEAFHLDHRIGSLQKGKDGDMVVFSGNPFEPMSKVLLVVCNGRVVVDNREQAQ